MPRLCLLLIICFFAVVIAKGGGRGGGGRGGGGRGRGSSYGRSSHSYPSSNGLSGNSAGNGQRTNSHTYPESTGKSGNNYKSTSYTQNNEVRYHYFPPKLISYGSQQHPVFVGNPPTYVYMYKDSGSKYNNLLTGLALYNLGRSSSHSSYSHRSEYNTSPGEICKLGISKSNGDYEETRIDCKLMSSFIWDAELENGHTKSETITNPSHMTNEGESAVIDALQDKGASIKVTPDMKCFMIRIARDSSILKKTVKCGLLEEYAARSLRFKYYTGQCARMVPTVILLVITFIKTLG